MRLRFSDRKSGSKGDRNNFFSNVKRKMLVAGLAVGMVFGASGILNAGKNPQAGTVAYTAAARKWLKANKTQFNLKPADKAKEAKLVKFISSKMQSGEWQMSGTARKGTKSWPYHPRCQPTTKNGDCWTLGFRNSWTVTATYCKSASGKADTVRCKAGLPRQEAPGYCYGYTDFGKYVNDCEMPFVPKKP